MDKIIFFNYIMPKTNNKTRKRTSTRKGKNPKSRRNKQTKQHKKGTSKKRSTRSKNMPKLAKALEDAIRRAGGAIV